jgi:DNA-binding MarR family transcriptional regulator
MTGDDRFLHHLQTSIKLMLKFFTNPDTRSYLQELTEEFGESTNAVRVELNRLSEAGFLRKRFGQDKVLVLWKGNNDNKTKEHQIDA